MANEIKSALCAICAKPEHCPTCGEGHHFHGFIPAEMRISMHRYNGKYGPEDRRYSSIEIHFDYPVNWTDSDFLRFLRSTGIK